MKPKRSLYPNQKPEPIELDTILIKIYPLLLLVLFILVMAILIYCQTSVAYMHTIHGGM